MCEIVSSLVGPILSSAMPTHELILHIAVALCFRPSATRCRALLQCDKFKTVILKVSHNSFPPVAKIYIGLASVWVYECTLRRNQGFSPCTVKPRQFTEPAGMMPWQNISQPRSSLTAQAAIYIFIQKKMHYLKDYMDYDMLIGYTNTT